MNERKYLNMSISQQMMEEILQNIEARTKTCQTEDCLNDLVCQQRFWEAALEYLNGTETWGLTHYDKII